VHPWKRKIQQNYGFVLNSVHQIDQLVETWGNSLQSRTVDLRDHAPSKQKVWATRIQCDFGSARMREVPLTFFRMVALMGDAL
jgi:hypothetical protein